MLAAPKSSIVTIWLWARAEIRGLRMGGADRELHGLMQAIGQAARAAVASLAVMTPQQKDAGLLAAAKALRASVPTILAANALDLQDAVHRGTSGAFLDRLRLDGARLEAVAQAFLILAIALAAFLGPSLGNAMIAIGITATPIFVRLTRGQTLAIKTEDYIEAARAVGNPVHRIALRHILPNVLPSLLVQATLTVATAIIAEASLSFLGLGQQPPLPSWGSMLNSAQRFLTNAPWMAIWPGLAIFVSVICFNLLGDGLRDALDPRSK